MLWFHLPMRWVWNSHSLLQEVCDCITKIHSFEYIQDDAISSFNGQLIFFGSGTSGGIITFMV
jgi:hypothetical protein